MGDLATQFYPWHMRLNAMLGRLDLPIWNHQILMGTPFLAESTPGTRYFVATEWNAGAGRLGAQSERFRSVFGDGMVKVFENPDAIPSALLWVVATWRRRRRSVAQLNQSRGLPA